MAERENAVEDYKAGLSYKEIADKHGVSESTVKSWASRYWNKDKKIKTARNKSKKLQPKVKKSCNLSCDVKSDSQVKNHGAPIGNKYSEGHTNALKHGGYSSVYWDTLSSDELEMIEDMEISEEKQLEDQLKLYAVRERRILKAIEKIRVSGNKTGSVEVCSSIGFSFNTDEKSVINAEGLYETKKTTTPQPTFSSKHIEKTEFAVLRLEKELTSVQRNKTRTIQALADIRRINGDNSSDWLDEFISAVEEVNDEEKE